MESRDIEKPFTLWRRDFFKVLGGGIYFLFNLGNVNEAQAAETEQRRTLPKDFNAFLRIAEDGTVTCYTGKIEMGQGVFTSLPQMMADELDVELEKVKIVMGDTTLCPYDAGTWGSLTTRQFGPAMLAATAEARAVLLSMGAEYLKTTPDQVVVSNGVISIKNNKKKKVTYGQLAKGQKIEKFLDVKPKPKDYSEYKIMGKSFLHADALEKVTGRALYTGDFRMPGMVWAKILRPPSHFAKLATVDTSGAEQFPGAQVIRDKDFIAVLHADPEKAEQALAKIRADYTFNEMEVDDKNVFDRMLKIPSNARVTASKGNLDSGRKNSGFLFESQFNNHYVAHAPIEPHTALAWMEGDIMMVRASTQSPFGTQEGVARELGVTLEKVRVIPPFLGGGFGGKAVSLQANEAAKLAKLSGKPVMVAWTREEEFFYDSFRPAAVVTIKSGITPSGEITLWDYHEYFAGSRGSETIYECPDQSTISHSSNQVHPFATGAWRAPANNTNTYARESQIDMMAAKAGMDPIEFRLKNLKDQRMIDVLKGLKEFVNWQPAVSPGKRGFGIACGFDAGGYVATMAEVKVNQATGEITVVRVACVQEIGFCVNPQGATIQMEGCITMGMGYALTEEVEFTGGAVKTSNFGTYKLPKFSWLPKIETKILDRLTPPQGGGEPAIITMGGALANAVYDACGARLYTLPMTPERVLAALARK